MLKDIVAAEALGDSRLHLRFEDGIHGYRRKDACNGKPSGDWDVWEATERAAADTSCHRHACKPLRKRCINRGAKS